MSKIDERLNMGRPIEEKAPSKPPEIETEGVFNQDYLEGPESFIDNPMAAFLNPLIQYFEAIKPKTFEPVKQEHKVRIFRFNDRTSLGVVEKDIEDLLNDGYCCHMPTVVGDYVIMDFARRVKESEENEREQ